MAHCQNQLGRIDDIQVTAESVGENQVKLNFHFVEKGRIDSISFQGNNHLSEQKLMEAIQTKQFDFIDEVQIQIDIKRIVQAYIQEGYSKVKVLYRWEEEKNKRNLVFQILESRRTYLTKIKIKGSKYFLPIDLERKMQSSEIDCFSWVNQSGRFDEQKISTDLQIISQAYFRDGFIEVEVSKPKIVFIISADFTTVEISFDVKEGKQYFVNNIEVRSLDEDRDLLLPKEEILEKIKLKPEDPYNIIQQKCYNLILQIIELRHYLMDKKYSLKDRVLLEFLNIIVGFVPCCRKLARITHTNLRYKIS